MWHLGTGFWDAGGMVGLERYFSTSERYFPTSMIPRSGYLWIHTFISIFFQFLTSSSCPDFIEHSRMMAVIDLDPGSIHRCAHQNLYEKHSHEHLTVFIFIPSFFIIFVVVVLIDLSYKLSAFGSWETNN